MGIPNLACKCILGWKSVPSHFGFTETFTSDLFSGFSIDSGAYLLYSLRYESLWCMGASLDGDMSRTILGHCALDL